MSVIECVVNGVIGRVIMPAPPSRISVGYYKGGGTVSMIERVR